MPKTIPSNRYTSLQNKSTNRISGFPVSWQQQLAQAISHPTELLQQLAISPEHFPEVLSAHQQFPLKVPQAYINKMQPGNPHDPLLLQVMTQQQEMLLHDGYNTNPVGDLEASKTPGLLHKYHGRVLLITTAACAIHCRYCFRRHFPYQQQQAGRDQWSDSLDYIRNDSSINEVILSGGDPLVLSDDKLNRLISQLENIPHLRRLRIHTRLPVVLAERITEELTTRLQQSPLSIVMVIHANHANEISSEEVTALHKLRDSNVQLLNQAVLLKGINHQLQQQLDLSEKLHSAGVLPYYLHLLDKVQGAEHFDSELSEAQQLIKQMQARLPGYLVPRLVQEIAGESGKTPANEL